MCFSPSFKCLPANKLFDSSQRIRRTTISHPVRGKLHLLATGFNRFRTNAWPDAPILTKKDHGMLFIFQEPVALGCEIPPSFGSCLPDPSGTVIEIHKLYPYDERSVPSTVKIYRWFLK